MWCQRGRDNNSLAVDDVTSPPPSGELAKGCLPAKEDKWQLHPRPQQKTMRSNKRTRRLTRGVVADKTDPASPVVTSQAPRPAAFPRHRAGGLAEMFNRRF